MTERPAETGSSSALRNLRHGAYHGNIFREINMDTTDTAAGHIHDHGH